MSEYSKLLRDPRWQKKRLEILHRDDFVCQKCHSNNKELHIHHKYYIKNLLPWEYADESLIAYCKDCHESEREQGSNFTDCFNLIRTHLDSDDIYFLQEFILRVLDNKETLSSFLWKLGILNDANFKSIISYCDKKFAQTTKENAKKHKNKEKPF